MNNIISSNSADVVEWGELGILMLFSYLIIYSISLVEYKLSTNS